ncbi:MAG: SEL1-like repeat protein [Deltaproteobacteria bacterium]|nr:SEL1-like repeat protein [Deltaproteobacteria bacterium]
MRVGEQARRARGRARRERRRQRRRRIGGIAIIVALTLAVFTTTAFDVFDPARKIGPPLPIGTKAAYPTLSLLEQSATLRSTNLLLEDSLPELVDLKRLFPSRSTSRSQAALPDEPDRPDVLMLDDFQAPPAKGTYLATAMEAAREDLGDPNKQASIDEADFLPRGYDLVGAPAYFGGPAAVPEPATGLLVAIGLLTLSLRQRCGRPASSRPHASGRESSTRPGKPRWPLLHLALVALFALPTGCVHVEKHVEKHLEIDWGGATASGSSAERVARYREEAETGFALAQYNLGLAYFSGEGIEVDKAKGVGWYRKAAEQSLPQAQYNLAIALMNGEGTQRDPLAAVEWFTAAAELGDAESQFSLGLLYLSGEFVDKDPETAFRWFTWAAEQDYAKAQANVGVAYLKGRGVAQNSALAAKWFEMAADKGHAQSQFNLGQAYEYGIGIPRDHARAAYWYEKSADQGIPTAQFRSGLAYRSGRGVQQDLVVAYKWFALAADAGYFESRERMQELEKSLTTADLAEARKEVQEWNQKHFSTDEEMATAARSAQ